METVTISIKVSGVDSMQRDLKKAEKSVSSFSNSVAKTLKSGFEKIGLGKVIDNELTRGLDSGLSKITSKISSFVKSIGKGAGLTGNIAIGTAIGNLISGGITAGISTATNLITKFASSIGNIIKDSVNSAANLEQIRIAFEVMLGNADSARKLLTDLSDFAAKTPFNLTELQELTQRLLAYGVAQEDIIPTLRDLGNISAGVGRDKLPFLITALGQVRAKTILSGEELKQFTETGVPLIEELSRVTGFSISEITDQTKDLGITYNQVRQALANLSGEGGKFNGLMDRQSKSFGGLMSNLGDYRDRILRMIGGIEEDGDLIEGGLLQRLSQGLQRFMGIIDANAPQIQEFFSAVSTKLGDIASQGFGQLMDHLPAIAKSLKEDIVPKVFEFADKLIKETPNIINQVGQVAEAFGKVVKGITDAINKFEDFRKGAGKLAEDVTRDFVNTFGDDLKIKDFEYSNALHEAAQELNVSLDDLSIVNTKVLENIKQNATSYEDAVTRIKHQYDKAKEDLGKIGELKIAFGGIQGPDGQGIGLTEGYNQFLNMLSQSHIHLKNLDESQIQTFINISNSTQDATERTRLLQDEVNDLAQDYDIALRQQVEDLANQYDLTSQEGIRGLTRLAVATDQPIEKIGQMAVEVQTARDQLNYMGISSVNSSSSIQSSMNMAAGAVSNIATQTNNSANSFWNLGNAIGNASSQLLNFSQIGNNIGGGIGNLFNTLSAGGVQAQGFADGGIVGGNSYSGDRLWARMNSGEMVLNQEQQSGLFSLLKRLATNGGNTTNIGNVSFGGEKKSNQQMNLFNQLLKNM